MTTLDNLMLKVNKEMGDIMFTGLKSADGQSKIPFSSPRLNYMLYGGFPVGRMIEFFGEEGGGKTTTALDAVKNAQIKFKNKRQILYIDVENTLNEDWAKTLGVDVKKLKFMRPQQQSAEEILEIAIQAISTGEVGLLVIDSIGFLIGQKELDGSLEDKQFCGISDVLTKFCKRVTPLLVKYNASIICINQIREDINSKFSTIKTPGGKAYKHALSLRLMFRKGVYFADDEKELPSTAETPAGHAVMISVQKTKVCRPDRRTGFYTLNYRRGVDIYNDYFDVAEKYGLIVAAGVWYKLIDGKTKKPLRDADDKEIKIQGRPGVIKFLKENEDIFDEIKKYVDEQNQNGL